MKLFKLKLISIIAAILLALLALPAQAQDTSSTASAWFDVPPIVYVIVVVLALLLVGALVYGGYITKFLATLVPPETAQSIYESGVRFGLNVALNQSAQTPSTLDDEFFTEMARARGLVVTQRPDGSYDVQPALKSFTLDRSKVGGKDVLT